MSDRLRTLSSPRIRYLAAAGAALTGLVVAGLPTAPATSAEPTRDCPGAVPVDQVQRGTPVHGLTTTHGYAPSRFTGKVLGVLEDGIAPGLDMVMVRLRGASITDADGDVKNGIWAGMSGSPVYTEDGRLLGAVAYGLSWSPSNVAGLTPAAEMLELSQDPAAARESAAPRRVDVSAKDARSSGLTSQEASGGFKRLPMPFSVSGGLSSQRLAKIADKLGIKRQLVAGSTAAADEPAPPIVPGGNLTASLSYGDITYAGIGTATAVCDGDEVVGFGHPLLWSGRSTYSMHNANAIYIQRDEVFGSFKVANPTQPVGGIFQDRLAGILGVNGVRPRETEVTSHVESTQGNNARDGRTVITYRDAIPYLSAIHLVANADRVLDQIGTGSAKVTWTAEGTRADGSPWQYSRSNRFASEWDITFESIWEPYSQLETILGNRFERVTIDDVHFDATYSPVYRALKLTKLEAKFKGEWVSVGRRTRAIKARAGSELPLRVTLTPSDRSEPVQRERLSVAVPKKARDAYLFVGAGEFERRVKASSFEDLLDELENAPRNNEVTATLYTESRRGQRTTTDSKVVRDVVSGGEFVGVRIVR